MTIAFNLSNEKSQAISFPDVYDYSDALLAENFEGVNPRYKFNTKEWKYIKNA